MCIFFLLLHLTMTILSVLNLQTPSYITSESVVCRSIFPLKNIVHLVINVFLAFLFAGSILNVTSISDLSFYQKTQKFGIVLAMLSAYNMLLKALNSANCEFWEMSWSTVLGQTLSILLEGAFIHVFFKWYYNKVKVVRDTMVTSIYILNREQTNPSETN